MAAAVAALALTSTFSISVTQILLGVATAALLVQLAVTRDGRPWATGLEGPLLALLIWAVAMVPLSADRLQSAVFLRRFYLFAALWLGAGLARGSLGPRVRRAVLVGLLAGGAGTAIYGLVAYARLGGAFVDAWDGFLKNRVVLIQGYMTAGGLMMVTCLVALAFLLTARPRRTRLLLGAALLPMAAALLLTLTRSAWLGTGAGALVMLVLVRRRLALLAAALAGGGGAAVALAGARPLPLGLRSGPLPELAAGADVADRPGRGGRSPADRGGGPRSERTLLVLPRSGGRRPPRSPGLSGRPDPGRGPSPQQRPAGGGHLGPAGAGAGGAADGGAAAAAPGDLACPAPRPARPGRCRTAGRAGCWRRSACGGHS